MPKAISSSSLQRRAYTITAILSLGKVISPSYSCCIKEGLVYIVIVTPSG